MFVVSALLGAMVLVGSTVLAGPPAKGKAKPAKLAKAVGSAAAGKVLLTKEFVTLCGGCHKMGNLGSGKMGPNLSHIGKQLPQAKILMVLKNPRSVNPKGMMPPVKRPMKQLQDMSAYLATLK
ncbi:MAG TPA: cytochrome c [Armatimonadota bacterium]